MWNSLSLCYDNIIDRILLQSEENTNGKMFDSYGIGLTPSVRVDSFLYRDSAGQGTGNKAICV